MAGMVIAVGKKARAVAGRVSLIARVNGLEDVDARHIEVEGRSIPDARDLRTFEESRLAFVDQDWRSQIGPIEERLTALRRAAPKASVEIHVVADLGDLFAAAALTSLVEGLGRTVGQRRSRATINLILIQPPQAAEDLHLAAAYDAFAGLWLLRRRGAKPGDASPVDRVWLLPAQVHAFRISQWILTKLQNGPETRAEADALGAFGICTLCGPVQRARDLLGQMDQVLADELPGPRPRRDGGRSKLRALEALYRKEAGNSETDTFEAADKTRGSIRTELAECVKDQDVFWRRLDEVSSDLGDLTPASLVPGDLESPGGPDRPLARAQGLLDLVERRRGQLLTNLAATRERIAQLRSYEGAYKPASMARAGREAAAQLVADSVMDGFDERVYGRLERRLRRLLAFEKARQYGDELLSALPGAARARIDGRAARPSSDTEGANTVSRILSGPSPDEEPQSVMDGLIAAMEQAADVIEVPGDDDWAAAFESAASEARLIANDAGSERRFVYASLPQGSPVAARAAPFRAEVRPQRLDGQLDLVVEREGIRAESVGALSRQRQAFFRLLKAGPMDAALIDRSGEPLASSLVVSFTGQERRRRADALLEFARALALGVAAHTDAGEISFYAGAGEGPRTLKLSSIGLAFDLLCEDESLLASLRDEVSEARRGSGDSEFELKLGLLLGRLAEGALKPFDSSLDSPLAREGRNFAARDPQAAARLERTFDDWTVQVAGPSPFQVLRRRP